MKYKIGDIVVHKIEDVFNEEIFVSKLIKPTYADGNYFMINKTIKDCQRYDWWIRKEWILGLATPLQIELYI